MGREGDPVDLPSTPHSQNDRGGQAMTQEKEEHYGRGKGKVCDKCLILKEGQGLITLADGPKLCGDCFQELLNLGRKKPLESESKPVTQPSKDNISPTVECACSGNATEKETTINTFNCPIHGVKQGPPKKVSLSLEKQYEKLGRWLADEFCEDMDSLGDIDGSSIWEEMRDLGILVPCSREREGCEDCQWRDEDCHTRVENLDTPKPTQEITESEVKSFQGERLATGPDFGEKP